MHPWGSRSGAPASGSGCRPRRARRSSRRAPRVSSAGVPDKTATTHHSFGGSFSAGSKPIFASKYAFFSIFQNLKENYLLASKFCKFLPKNVEIFAKFFDIFWQILQFFAKFSEIHKIFAKFCRIFGRILQKFVDFEKCWKMLHWMQKFMKNLLKFNEILTKFCHSPAP